MTDSAVTGRLDILEMRNAHQEAALEEMTRTLLTQEQQLREQEQRLLRLEQQVRALQGGAGSGQAEEKPPHY
jgi:uncharacterized coiled-coil protein SlyX